MANEIKVADKKVAEEATPSTTPTITMTQEMFDQLMGKVSKVDALLAILEGVSKKNGRGGRHTAQPVLDTKTGKVYRTKASAGMAVAPEYGLKIHNFVWYELVKGTKSNPAKCPNRFKDITPEEYEAKKPKS